MRVGRDHFRFMLRDSGWLDVREDMITDLVRITARKALMLGYNVIIDNTHLSIGHEFAIRSYFLRKIHKNGSFRKKSIFKLCDARIAGADVIWCLDFNARSLDSSRSQASCSFFSRCRVSSERT